VAVKERSNNQWLAALRGGPNRDEALADLRVLLKCDLRGAEQHAIETFERHNE
jgi:hypothetical protein